MRAFDHLVRNWRFRIAEPFVSQGCRIADIGGYDGSFLHRVYDKIESGICIDPVITEKQEGKLSFIRAEFGKELALPKSSFDVVTLLAVYEHLGEARELVTAEVFRILKNHGMAVLTVPSAAVDDILHFLIKLRIADGQHLEEHQHFDPSQTVNIFTRHGFLLKHWSRFQFGLNNLFVFEKVPSSGRVGGSQG